MATNWSARDIATLVRDALETYQQQQNGQGEPTLIEELEAEAKAGLRSIQTIIDGMATQERIWLSNGMDQMLAAGIEPGGNYSAERWLEIRAMFRSFAAWLKTPIEIMPATEGVHDAVALVPIVVISRRTNPQPGWGVIQQPEPTPEPQPDPAPEP